MIFAIWSVAFVGGIWIISTYTTLTALRLRVQNAWHQIDVQLKRRDDSVARLVEIVKGYVHSEQETLAQVNDARANARAAAGAKQAGAAQAELSASLGKVFALMENYPGLKADRKILDLHEELAMTENKIAVAREYYNDLVAQYNSKQLAFPGNLIAGCGKFQLSESFFAPEVK